MICCCSFRLSSPARLMALSVSYLLLRRYRACSTGAWFNSCMSYTSPTPRQRFMKALAICIPSVYDQCMIIELLLTRDCSLERSEFACIWPKWRWCSPTAPKWYAIHIHLLSRMVPHLATEYADQFMCDDINTPNRTYNSYICHSSNVHCSYDLKMCNTLSTLVQFNLHMCTHLTVFCFSLCKSEL